MLTVAVWTCAASAQTADSQSQLYDALLIESQGDLEGAVAKYTELTHTLWDADPALPEALYWAGHGLWSLGRVAEARQALLDGIRIGRCPRCRDLLEVIEIDNAAIDSTPARFDFEHGNRVLFHPWVVQELGSIQVSARTPGQHALEWSTIARPGEPDRLVLGLREPVPAPTTLAFELLSEKLDALIDVVADDDGGRSFALLEPVSVPRGSLRTVTVDLAGLVPVDSGPPLDPTRVVLLSIVDRTGSRAAGQSRLWLDDLELR